MLTEEAALRRVLDGVSPLPPAPLPLTAALLGLRLAAPVYATVPLPTFDNSAMDGYAVRAVDTTSATPLPVVAEQPAGPDRRLQLPAGAAIRLFTGAPMPAGADAVIMQEDVTRHEEPARIVCREPVEPGENVRLTGCDLCVGQKLGDKGQMLTPALLGVLASQGLTTLTVHPRPRVAIISTGDELAPAGQTLAPGQIYNSNGVMLDALVRECGAHEVTVTHLPDDLEATAQGLHQAIAGHDFVILSGGVSVGDHDCIKPALKSLGLAPEFWRVKVKPGKPLLYLPAPRAEGGRCHLFGLPGNPVSSFVTFQLFVRPAIAKALGTPDEEAKETQPRLNAVLTAPLKNPGDRPHYVRGVYAHGEFTALGLQQSHALFGLSRANALLRMEAGQDLATGETVTGVMVFGPLP